MIVIIRVAMRSIVSTVGRISKSPIASRAFIIGLSVITLGVGSFMGA